MQGEDLVKQLLGALVKAILDNDDKKHDDKKHEEKKHEEKPDDCKRNEFHLTNTSTKPLSSLSGGYNGSEFIISKQNESESMVAGHLKIKGIEEEIPASFVFSSNRYDEKRLYDEVLRIVTPKGDAVAQAIYTDTGDGILSAAPFADYEVHTCYGELRDAKGHKIRITFDNRSPCKPRSIALVPGFGPSKKDARLLE